MDYLILGGFGYLGSRLVDHFSLQKINIKIGTSSSQIFKLSKVEIIRNYRKLDFSQLCDLVNEFDLVIDCSGISGSKISSNKIPEIIETNSIWPTKLAKACLEKKTKLVWFSTFHCKNLIYSHNETIRSKIYGLSKIIAESSINEFKDWEQYISIVRLGNIIGAPGKCFNGESNLFPLEISKSLVNEGKAIIKSDPNKKIGYVAFSELLNSNIFNIPGFYEIYNKNEISLYSLASTIKKKYEILSGGKFELLFKGQILKNNSQEISNIIKKEIEIMINYFIEKKKNSELN